MNISDIKINQKVKCHFRHNDNIGKIIKKLKTVVYVQFNYETVKFDKAHLQFLEVIK